MASTGGANTAVDGLVFGYDTGYPLVSGNLDTYKFNKGEPTVNIRASSGLDGSYSASGRTIDNSGTLIAPDGSTGWSSISSPGSDANYRIAKFTYNSLTGGTTYTFTLELYNPGPNSLEIFVDGNNGYAGTTIPLGYSRWSYTITPDTNKTQAIFFGAENKQANATYSPERLIYFKNYLVEENPHATPFTTGTRSVSGSLIDLTRTTDIDLSNVSFDSNAQMTFDGTDDYIDVSTTTLFQPQNSTDGFTVEYVYKPEANTSVVPVGNLDSSNGWFQAPIASSNTLGAYLYLTTPGVVLSTNNNYFINSDIIGKYQHIVMVLKWSDTSNSFIMVNGEDKTASKTAASKYTVGGSANPGLRIGKRGSSIWPANGEISMVKIYNRALTAQEVLQNYNAVKERFNL